METRLQKAWFDVQKNQKPLRMDSKEAIAVGKKPKLRTKKAKTHRTSTKKWRDEHSKGGAYTYRKVHGVWSWRPKRKLMKTMEGWRKT